MATLHLSPNLSLKKNKILRSRHDRNRGVKAPQRTLHVFFGPYIYGDVNQEYRSNPKMMTFNDVDSESLYTFLEAADGDFVSVGLVLDELTDDMRLFINQYCRDREVIWHVEN